MTEGKNSEELFASNEQPEETPVDHSVPYPEAPAVDHDDETQEHYRGARDPELKKKGEESPSFFDPSRARRRARP